MQTKNNKRLTLISLIVIAIFSLAVMCFCLGNNKALSSSWTVEPKQSTADAFYQPDSVILQNDSDLIITNLYVYVGNVYNCPNGKITLTVDSSGSDTLIKGDSYFGLNRQTVDLDISKGGHRWIKINLNGSISAKYIKIGTTASFEIIEFSATAKEGEIITLSCYGAKVWSNGKHVFTSSTNDTIGFSAVCDEQSAIYASGGINGLSEREVKFAGAIKNLIEQNPAYVSESENALGVIINLPAVLIFGLSPFGLRITNFLFFVFTLYLIFFMAKAFFGKIGYALSAVGLYLLGGLSLSLATNAGAINAGIFLTLASVYIAYKYLCKATSAKNVRVHSNLIVLSGLTFALAISVWAFALFALPVILAFILYPSVKGIKQATSEYNEQEGLEKEYAREKQIKTISRVVVNCILGFIILPFAILLLTFGICYPVYGGFYNTNFFISIFKNFARIFTSQQKGLFLSWIVGLGQTKLPSDFGFTTYILANRAYSILATVAFVFNAVIYLLAKLNKIKNGDLQVALNQSKTNYLVINLTFVVTFLLNIFFWGTNEYSNFAICLIFLTFNLLYAYKFLRIFASKAVRRTITVVGLTVVAVFFVLHLPIIFNINLPEKLQLIYSWLI